MLLTDIRFPAALLLATLLVGGLLILLRGLVSLAGRVALAHCFTFAVSAGDVPVE
jgi:hypothetical protein